MSTIPLPERPDLAQLRKQARELQRRVGAGDPAALTLAAEHQVPVSAGFALSSAQLALARHYGFVSWPRLRRHVEVINARTWTRPDPPPDESRADRFLRLACLNYTDDDPAHRIEAAQLLAANPELPGTDLNVAVACADVEQVRRLLPSAPPPGPYGWSPLMYQAFARVDVSLGDTLRTARLLLDAGADPNDGRFFLGLPIPFTVLTGIFAGDSRDQPAHSHAIAFGRLLLESGADPNDGQTLYNRMFGRNDDHLDLLFDFSLGEGEGGPWHQLLGDQLESPRHMLAGLLGWAAAHDQRERIALLAARGVDVLSAIPARWGSPRTPMTPLDIALSNGHRELAEQLRGYGAGGSNLDAVERLVAAALAADTEAVATTPASVLAEARRARPGLVVWASALGRVDAVELLLRMGFDVNAYGREDAPIEQKWQTALHTAAHTGDVALARVLLEHGADPALRDRRYDQTPLDWARHFDHDRIIELLG